MEHRGPAVPGGVVTVTMAAGDEVVRVEVTGQSGDGVQVLPTSASAAGEARRGEAGRGPRLVHALSVRRGGGLAVTWFEPALG